MYSLSLRATIGMVGRHRGAETRDGTLDPSLLDGADHFDWVSLSPQFERRPMCPVAGAFSGVKGIKQNLVVSGNRPR